VRFIRQAPSNGCAPGFRAAEHEGRRQAERDRDDRLREVPLVTVLVQRQARTGLVEIDQAGIGIERGESRFAGRHDSEVAQHRWHRGPRPAALRIDRIVAVAAAVGDPRV
jgi:hypothetical protein